MHIIENDFLKAAFVTKGAELTSVYSKENGLEYMWGGDPVFWGKHSPVLFPIVGALKQNAYVHNGKEYTLSRHGFARDSDFIAASSSGDSISFTLRSDETSLSSFPFPFEFTISYTLKGHSLEIAYSIVNTGNTTMLFSLGAHPAFKAPLKESEVYEDYYLSFDSEETLDRWSVTADGLIAEGPTPFLKNEKRIPLTKALFSGDALVFKHPASRSMSLRSNVSQHGLSLTLEGFPYLGIWAAKGANFVCIEPWCGIADGVRTDRQLAHKEGICQLPPAGVFDRKLTLTLF